MQKLDLSLFIDEWFRIISYGLFAALGGAIGYFELMRQASDNKLSIMANLLITIGSSAFAGMLALMILDALAIDTVWAGPVCGMTGWFGADQTLKLLRNYLFNRFLIDRRKPDH